MSDPLDYQIMQIVTSVLSSSSGSIERQVEAAPTSIEAALTRLHEAGLLKQFKDPVKDETYWTPTETGFHWLRQQSASASPSTSPVKIPA